MLQMNEARMNLGAAILGIDGYQHLIIFGGANSIQDGSQSYSMEILMPTSSPTPAPTHHPTPSPTKSPTNAPTFSPTMIPTTSPSNSPTWSPSMSPTKNPTGETASPTLAPTFSPSVTPTNSPTIAPSQSPTDSHVQYVVINAEQSNIDINYDLYIYVTSGIVIMVFVVTVGGYVHSKTENGIDFKVIDLLKFVIYLLDFVSDLFFCAHLYYYIKIDHVFYGLFIGSIVFLVIPAILSTYGMWKFISNYIVQYPNDENIKIYFTKYVFCLYICCIVIGNLDGTISLFSCQLFNRKIFCMNINDKQRVLINNKHSLQSGIFENLPQLIISIIYSIHGYQMYGYDMKGIVIFTYIFGLISIVISFIAYFTRRKIIKYSTIVDTEFDVEMDSYQRLD